MAHRTPSTTSQAEHTTGKVLAVPGAPRAVLALISVGHLVPGGNCMQQEVSS